jgi:hypothetical protein
MGACCQIQEIFSTKEKETTVYASFANVLDLYENFHKLICYEFLETYLLWMEGVCHNIT